MRRSMGRRPKTAAEWLERYEKKAQKAYNDYQATGIARYYRQYEEYDIISAAFRALADRSDKRAAEFERRLSSCNRVKDRLLCEKYTREEVIDLLQDAIYW